MRKILIGSFLLFLSLITTKIAWADDAVSLKVAPLFFDLAINPGEQKTGEIYVQNNSANDTDVTVNFPIFLSMIGGIISFLKIRM